MGAGGTQFAQDLNTLYPPQLHPSLAPEISSGMAGRVQPKFGFGAAGEEVEQLPTLAHLPRRKGPMMRYSGHLGAFTCCGTGLELMQCCFCTGVYFTSCHKKHAMTISALPFSGLEADLFSFCWFWSFMDKPLLGTVSSFPYSFYLSLLFCPQVCSLCVVVMFPGALQFFLFQFFFPNKGKSSVCFYIYILCDRHSSFDCLVVPSD